MLPAVATQHGSDLRKKQVLTSNIQPSMQRNKQCRNIRPKWNPQSCLYEPMQLSSGQPGQDLAELNQQKPQTDFALDKAWHKAKGFSATLKIQRKTSTRNIKTKLKDWEKKQKSKFSQQKQLTWKKKRKKIEVIGHSEPHDQKRGLDILFLKVLKLYRCLRISKQNGH